MGEIYKEINSSPAFKDDFTDPEFTSGEGIPTESIKRIKSLPHQLVRLDIGFYERKTKGKLNYEKSLPELEFAIKQSRAVFEELREYGINIAQFGNTVITNDEQGRVRTFTPINEIEGIKLGEVEKIPAQALPLLRDYIRNIFQYYNNKYMHGGDVWTNPGLQQLMYGHEHGAEEDKVYLVDIGDEDVNFVRYQPKHASAEPPQSREAWFKEMLVILQQELQSIQNKTDPPEKFREYFGDITEEIKKANLEQPFHSISLDPKETFASKISPIFESIVIDTNTGEKIGTVKFQLNHRDKTIIVQDINIDKPRQGYGIEVYKTIQQMYPDYQLQSSDQMTKRETASQMKPNAVYLWEKLVREGLAEGDANVGFKMKKLY
jgi:hypothetical protein